MSDRKTAFSGGFSDYFARAYKPNSVSSLRSKLDGNHLSVLDIAVGIKRHFVGDHNIRC